jgi:hypothetical protein
MKDPLQNGIRIFQQLSLPWDPEVSPNGSIDSLWFLTDLSNVPSMPFGSCPKYSLSLNTVIPSLEGIIFVS